MCYQASSRHKVNKIIQNPEVSATNWLLRVAEGFLRVSATALHHQRCINHHKSSWNGEMARQPWSLCLWTNSRTCHQHRANPRRASMGREQVGSDTQRTAKQANFRIVWGSDIVLSCLEYASSPSSPGTGTTIIIIIIIQQDSNASKATDNSK